MDYSYSVENNAIPDITLADFSNKYGINMLHILCYHINTETKYPFLQFLVDKIPYCNNMIKEQFALPYVMYTDCSSSVSELVLDRVKSALFNMNCDDSSVTNDMYKGIFYDQYNVNYALVNLGKTDINALQLGRDNTSWFVLPSEIINGKEVLNIGIDEQLVDLFLNNPQLSLLTNVETNEPFIIPDVAYTGDEFKRTQFHSIFGVSKQKVYNSCGQYFYFYRGLDGAVRDGGWSQNALVYNEARYESVFVDNEYGRYKKGGITRYAVFVEGKMYIESGDEFSLTEDDIEELYPDPCIIICYSNSNQNQKQKQDLLIKNFNSFFPISCHELDKRQLSESNDLNNQNKRIWIQ
jgi:hypothetical protein